jgi:hypothetical protein
VVEIKGTYPAEFRFDPRLKWVVDTTPGRVLNLGAGINIIHGATNHDRTPRPDIQIAFDLMEFPWPIEKETFKTVGAFHVLEHIPISFCLRFFQECHRILTLDGGLIIEVPDIIGMAKQYLDGNMGIIGRMYGEYLYPGEGHVWGWDKSQLMLIARLSGFKVCITKEGSDYHSVQIPTIRLEAVRH